MTKNRWSLAKILFSDVGKPNASLSISLWQLAMFALWRSQKSLRKYKDTIIGNHLLPYYSKQLALFP